MPTVDATALGKMVKAFRSREGLTQAALAESVAVTDETISRIERGALEPELSTIVAVADVLGVSVDELLGRAIRDGERATELPLVRQLAARARLLDAKVLRILVSLANALPEAEKRTKS